jgi:hypothetical protein
VHLIEHRVVRREHRRIRSGAGPQVAHDDSRGRQSCAHRLEELACRERIRHFIIGERVEHDEVVRRGGCVLDECAAIAGMHDHARVGREAEEALGDIDDDRIDLDDIDVRVRHDLSCIHRHRTAAEADEEDATLGRNQGEADLPDARVCQLEVQRATRIQRTLPRAASARDERAQAVASFHHTDAAEIRVALEDDAGALGMKYVSERGHEAGRDDERDVFAEHVSCRIRRQRADVQ